MTPEQMAERLDRRVRKQSTEDLLMWAETAAMGMQRYVDDFRRTPDESYLGEISLAAATMGAVAQVLAERVRAARKH